MKTKQKIALGLGAGLLGYFLWPKEVRAAAAAALPSSDMFESLRGVRFFRKERIAELRKFLDANGIQPFGREDLPQAAQLVPGVPSPSALAWVKRRQLAGFAVGVSDDVLLPSRTDPTMFASVFVEDGERAFGDPTSHWAVLPPL